MRTPGLQKAKLRKSILLCALFSILFSSIPSNTNNTLARAEENSDTERFGRAYGGKYYDTHRYLAGDIVVGVFFQTHDSWTEAEIEVRFSEVRIKLNRLCNEEPNAHINFIYIKEVDQNGNPKDTPEDRFAYVNNLRNTYNAAWAFYVIIGKGAGGAMAGKPYITIADSALLNSHAIIHEALHLFGAADQYEGARIPATARQGYLNTVNGNSEYNNGDGFFGGRGEAQPDIMIGPWGMGVHTRGQIGWRDSDGDGILDVLDTHPKVFIETKRGISLFTYEGYAEDQAIFHERKTLVHNNVTINHIKSVEYRINSGAWMEASPLDGSFDYAYERFGFTTPALKNGIYDVEIKATNSVGNQSTYYAKDALYVTDSVVTSANPIAHFTINPEKGSIGTTFEFDASKSSDFEDYSSLLEVSWDFNNDGIWDTPFTIEKKATYRYSSPGIKIVRLEVKNSRGLADTCTREITVTLGDLPPEASFIVTPENMHGDNAFHIAVNATRSYDAEDEKSLLQIRWDFEDDGVWDTSYSNDLISDHTYIIPGETSNYYRIRLEVKDTTGNTSEATRSVWAVTYNNPPTLDWDFEISDGVIKALGGNDPDIWTTWDGLLEYRWDFEDDGVWDTRFSEDNFVAIPTSYQDTPIECEVKDRFGATRRALFTNDPTPEIISISADSVFVGEQVAIVGYNFGITQGAGCIELSGGTQALIESWSDREIIFTVKKSTGGPVEIFVENEAGASNRVSLMINLLWGDITGNGTVSSLDASRTLQYVLGMRELNDEQKRVADVTRSGEITRLDADLILRCAVGLISLPVTNHAPELVNPGGRKAIAGKPFEITLESSDPDNDENTIFYSAQIPKGAKSATFNEDTGTFSWKPPKEGSHQIVFQVTDGELSDSEEITIQVNKPSSPRTPPKIIRQSSYYARRNRPVTITGKNFGEGDAESGIFFYSIWDYRYRRPLALAQILSWDNGKITFKVKNASRGRRWYRRWLRWFRFRVKTRAGWSNSRWLLVR